MTTERNPQGHTPGEWYLNAGNETEVQAGTKQVARAHCGGMTGVRLIEAEANARLIASAPELLEALQGMLAVHDMTQSPAGDRIAAWSGAVNAARAAIAKATLGGEGA